MTARNTVPVRELGLAATMLALAAVACNGPTGGSGSKGGSTATAEDGDETIGDRFDLASNDVEAKCDPDGENGGGEYDFVNLWVSNSTDGTVSKIDTRKRKEVGRYRSGPGDTDPSRTSVNLLGDMVVVNRSGSITKILGRTEACIDENGNETIDTSQGPDDVLDWESDECVVWHRELTQSTGPQNQWGPRPVAWEGGTLDPVTCEASPRVWVGWYDQPANAGEFRRLDGESGEVLDEVSVPWSGNSWGPYGGAVDQDGAFWVIGWKDGPLVRVDEDGDSYEVHTVPDDPNAENWTYGIALDEHGNPWISSAGSVLNFDVETEEWGRIDTGNKMMRGLAADADGNLWIAVEEDAFEECGLAVVDTEEHQLLAASITLFGCGEPVGVSVDADDYVWVVDYGVQWAFRLNPATYEIGGGVGGLLNPYTYSDMTGAGLNLVAGHQEG